MRAFPLRRRAPLSWSLGLLLTTALVACNGDGKPAATGSADASAAPNVLPLSTTTPATLAPAPPVTALPGGQPVRMARLNDRREGYRYLDRGLYQENAVEDAPPDYSFEEGGVRPWTWGTGDGARVISEPVADGYRTYYYNAGSDAPYLVRDPRYAYAYDHGALVAAFTVGGVQIDLTEGSDLAQYGSRYYSRAHTLWARATSGPHLAVNAYAWGDRRADVAAQRMQWQRHIAENPDWSAWHSAHETEEQAPWSEARAQHQQAAQQFGAWQDHHFRGAPPQMYGDDAPPPTPAPAPQNRAAAIAGGVVAAGIVASAVHRMAEHHAAPHPTMGPAASAPAQRAPFPASAEHRANPDQHKDSVAPDHPVAAQPVQAHAAPVRVPVGPPQHVRSNPPAVQPAVRPAPHAPPVAPQQVRPSRPPVQPTVRPAPHAPPVAPQPKQTAPHPEDHHRPQGEH